MQHRLLISIFTDVNNTKKACFRHAFYLFGAFRLLFDDAVVEDLGACRHLEGINPCGEVADRNLC